MNTPSKLLDQGVEAFASLPGIGRKTALRLALHMLRQSKEEVAFFSNSVSRMRMKSSFAKHAITFQKQNFAIFAAILNVQIHKLFVW